MGTNSSKNEEEKEDEESIMNNRKRKSFGTIDLSILNGDNLSAYSGLKSEGGSVVESIDKENITSTLKPELKDEKIPTLFEWNEGGQMVYITGSFCSWTQFFIMSRVPNGTFQLVLDLPKGVYQYKFKVDNQWKYNTTAPTISDNEKNVNNIVDTTNIVPPPSTEKENMNTTSKEKIISKIKQKEEYGSYYPGKLELNTDAPGVPLKFYSNLFNIDLNTKQWIIGNKSFLHKEENNILSENNSFKSLARCPHISIYHLIYQYNNPSKISFEVVCQTSRLRHKMLSYVYYKPRKSNKKRIR